MNWQVDYAQENSVSLMTYPTDISRLWDMINQRRRRYLSVSGLEDARDRTFAQCTCGFGTSANGGITVSWVGDGGRVDSSTSRFSRVSIWQLIYLQLFVSLPDVISTPNLPLVPTPISTPAYPTRTRRALLWLNTRSPSKSRVISAVLQARTLTKFGGNDKVINLIKIPYQS